MHYYLLSICLCWTVWLHGQSACSRGQTEVIIELQTDRYGYETSWELTGSTGTSYASVRPFTYQSQRLYRDTFCAPAGECLRFTLYDAFGDGIEAPGYYFLLVNGDTVAHPAAFYLQQTVYLQCPEGTTCAVAQRVTLGQYTASIDDTWYQFTPDSSGLYVISTRDLNTCDTKIWIYGSCEAITIAEDNQSTLFFNDNATAHIPQAEVKGYFKKGKTYYIRVGDRANACADSIRWRILFEGVIRGCTDLNACNYNPLASVDDGSCLAAGHVRCPKGPDLRIRQDTLLHSLHLDTVLADDACLVQEGCLRGYGVRQVLRFSTQIENIGERDYYVGRPVYTNPKFTWNNCHNHFHYDSYAEYIIIDEWGKKMPIGFKSGLCITDLGCDPGYNPKFSCDNMGISPHCYDLYWSALKCQWIDVTDLPDGRYTLVVRINWQNTPDALGQIEKNLDNNVAQVCFRLRRVVGKLQYTLESPCEPYLDCADTPFGDAQPDCQGICNGTHLAGDVNGNGRLEIADAESYVTLMLGNDIEPTPCYDLNSDGAITVQDAVLLASCLQFGTAHPHLGAGIHDHCQFPVSYLLNTQDTVALHILHANWEKKYVDIGIWNPSTHVNAYQFRLTGGSISHVENLADDTAFPVTPRTNMSAGTVIGVSYRDSVIRKSALPQPLCRVHFLQLSADTIRLEEIVAIVNNHHERTATRLTDSLAIRRRSTPVPQAPTPMYIHMSPNPFGNEAQFTFYHPQQQDFRLEISNINGQIVQQYLHVQPPGTRLQRDQLPAGIYFYKLIGEQSYATGRFMIR